jgi:Asp-tRNA(Asn)/Glu-tRNA(Gln) amidotransferase A subunit family amidase
VNSIRSPSSANNLVGIRPTKGLISLEGIIPVSFTQDSAGPLARTVEDAVIMLEAMIGNDVHYMESLHEHGLKGKKIGVLLNLFGREKIHEEVNRITELAIEEMKSLGAQMIDITIRDLDTDRLISDVDVQRYEMKHELDKYFSSYNTPVKALDEFIIKGGYDPSLGAMLKTVQSLESPLEHADYLKRLDDIKNLKRDILNIMNDHQ